MSKAPTIIHHFGRPHKARTLSGKWVEREDRLYVPSHKMSYPCMEYDNHFIYYDGEHIGSTLMCTCGAAGVTVGYDAYRHYMSYCGEKVIACMHQIQHGKHADGST